MPAIYFVECSLKIVSQIQIACLLCVSTLVLWQIRRFVCPRIRSVPNRNCLSDAIDHLSGSNKWGLKNSIKIINACYFSSAICRCPNMRDKNPVWTQIQLSFLLPKLPGLYPITLGHFIDKNKAVQETVKDFDEYVFIQ